MLSVSGRHLTTANGKYLIFSGRLPSFPKFTESYWAHSLYFKDEALPSEESPDGALSEYQKMGDLVSYEFDQSCDTVQYRVRQDERPYLANNALMSNFIVAYLLQVVKW